MTKHFGKFRYLRVMDWKEPVIGPKRKAKGTGDGA
jgi:hypothetical protein